MPFNNFENKYTKKTEKDIANSEISRRYFLKSMGELAKLAVIKTALNIPSGKLLETTLEKIQSSQEKKNSLNKTKIEKKEKKEEDKSVHNIHLEKSEKNNNLDIASTENRLTFKKTLKDFSLKKVKFSLALQKSTEEYYLQKYQSNSQVRKDIKQAFKRIDKWLPLTNRIFKKERVPPELVFLAVPESQGRKKACSSRGAVGMFQITKRIGRQYGMKINRHIDERLQVDKSALVCACILKDNYQLLKDWDLALLAYNGSFVWSYAQQAPKNKKYSLDGFLKFMERRVNQIKENLNKPYWIHKIKKENSLMSVARKYELEWSEIDKCNNFKKDQKGNPIIYHNQKIKIPLNSQKVKKKIYTQLTAGYIENLDYLPKVKATIQLAQQNFKGKNYS